MKTPLVLVRALNQWAVSATRQHYVFHAGAVERGGRAILLPGESGSGKTTLSVGLATRGFELLSDEVGAIELAANKLVPYPRAPWIRPDVFSYLDLPEDAGAALEQGGARLVALKEIGIRRAEGHAELALIVMPVFSPRAKTQLDRLETGSAVVALIQASCSQKRFKVAGLDRLIDLVRRIPCFRLTFSDLESALQQIEQAFELAAGSREADKSA